MEVDNLGFSSFLDIDDTGLKSLYLDVIAKERKLNNGKNWDDGIFNANDIAGVTKQIMEVATQSLVLRCFNNSYGLTNNAIAYESDGAHVNLLKTLLVRTLRLILRCFNNSYGLTNDTIAYESDGAHVNLLKTLLVRALRFRYRNIDVGHIPYLDEIFELADRHDLPENKYNDSADNGSRDEAIKNAREFNYWEKYSKFTPSYERELNKRTNLLLGEFVDKTTALGRFTACGDKLTAVLIALCCDFHGHSPIISKKSPEVSDLNRHEMEICQHPFQRRFKASELWTVDFLIERQFSLLDDSGFFNAVLVMATLLVKGAWYPWRLKQYLYL